MNLLWTLFSACSFIVKIIELFMMLYEYSADWNCVACQVGLMIMLRRPNCGRIWRLEIGCVLCTPSWGLEIGSSTISTLGIHISDLLPWHKILLVCILYYVLYITYFVLHSLAEVLLVSAQEAPFTYLYYIITGDTALCGEYGLKSSLTSVGALCVFRARPDGRDCQDGLHQIRSYWSCTALWVRQWK